MFWHRLELGRARVAFTDRHGGVSSTPFESLNLGFRAGDDPEAVERNFGRVADGLGLQPNSIVSMRQVHGGDTSFVSAAPATPPTADGLITNEPGLALCVRVADCAPVLLADQSVGVVGCAHAGRVGLAAGVVPSIVAAMRELGADQITAFVGPHVCGSCYEVPAALRAEVAAVVPQAYSTTSWGTPALDLGAGVRSQLVAAACEVVETGGCTMESSDLFSYRREGRRSGRQAGLVSLRG